mmetsp:Transcript_5609/g.15701  ORF Transcript_5609/g.15701 Transcript_5609/m.15701 type:complete len:180 (-) Transcript_5609:1425-1964(-)
MVVSCSHQATAPWTSGKVLRKPAFAGRVTAACGVARQPARSTSTEGRCRTPPHALLLSHYHRLASAMGLRWPQHGGLSCRASSSRDQGPAESLDSDDLPEPGSGPLMFTLPVFPLSTVMLPGSEGLLNGEDAGTHPALTAFALALTLLQPLQASVKLEYCSGQYAGLCSATRSRSPSFV